MTTPSTAPKEQVRIFDRRGRPLCQFRAAWARSWVINGEGRASAKLAVTKTQYVNDDMLRYGNWILIQNDSLPDWVGMIDVPREWGNRVVTVNAFTPERQFMYRRGPLEVVLTGSAGSIAEQLLTLVNAAENTILRAGDIWRGGVQRQETVNPTRLSQNLAGLSARSHEEYSWRPIINPQGRLLIYMDWFSRLGERTSVILQEGKKGGNIEVSDAPMVEDAPIVNDLLGYGQGTTWKTRPSAVTLASDDSRERFGLRQDSQNWNAVIDLGTIRDNNEQRLSNVSYPDLIFSVTALNRGDTFKYLGLGNRLTLRLASTGFTGDNVGVETLVRIIGMGYNPIEGQKMVLNVRETRY